METWKLGGSDMLILGSSWILFDGFLKASNAYLDQKIKLIEHI